jgi:uncharacterized damage-inducible protein DinB
MPSTTQERPAKKTLANADGDAPPRKAKSPKRAKKAESTDEAADEGENSRTVSTETASKKSAKRSASRESSADESEPKPKTKKRSPKTAKSESESEPAPERASKGRPPIDLDRAVLRALATNERMNQFLLENLDEKAWTAAPPSGKGRTIAAIVAHMHNVRHMWLVVIAKGSAIPDKLDRTKVTKPAAMKALAKSSAALLATFENALENGGHVKIFRPDAVGFLGYVIAHESHHRGQICMLARELGLELSKEARYGMWDWNKRCKESKVKR